MTRFTRFFLPLITLLSVAIAPAYAAKTTFADGNPVSKLPGTKVTAAFLNATNNHRHDGKAVDGSGILDYAADAGAENAITVTLSPALTAHVVGMPIYVKVSNTNTGAATIAVNALASKPLKKLGNTALAAGDIRSGQVVPVAYDGTNYQLLSTPPSTDAATLQGQSAAMLAPPGAIMDFAMQVCPAGWIETNGSTVLRAQYTSLYAAIGTTWGEGDGVTTFTLPEFRGEFRRTWDHGRGVDTGRDFASWQADSFKAHKHDLAFAYNGTDGAQNGAMFPSGDSSGDSTGSDWIGSTGGTETRPRNWAVQTCIKY
jgi:microcystin-dependent protein